MPLNLSSGKGHGQKTFMPTSKDGLDFNQVASEATEHLGIYPVPLGRSYFRVFSLNEQVCMQFLKLDIHSELKTKMPCKTLCEMLGR